MAVALSRKKVVIVGDSYCGKSAMLFAFIDKRFVEQYSQTIFETYVAKMDMDARNFELVLWDSAGLDEYDKLRALSYTDAEVILICFSVDSPTSFANVFDKWVPEIKYYCHRTPIILVGLKTDLRADPRIKDDLKQWNADFIRREDAEAMRERIGAFCYLECSAKERSGVEHVFEMAARVAFADPNAKLAAKARNCSLL